jgi:hypothetical protein
MNALETVVVEIDGLERQLSRRRVLQLMTLVAVVPGDLKEDSVEFLRGVADSLIPAAILKKTGIDVVANVHRLLDGARHDHRVKVVRLVTWARRISFLYGGDKIALRARGSRFALVQKLAKALASLCLVAFWGDPRTLAFIDIPEPAER